MTLPEILLQTTALVQEFEPGKPVLQTPPLAFAPSSLSLLAGRNGSGKTVCSKILAGLIGPSRGEVRVNSTPLREYPGGPAAVVGYAFQDARIQAVGERVLDDCLFGPMNLGKGAAEAAAMAQAALGACGLWERRKVFVHSLSGGELRRLSLAGILALDPAVLVLDEPFANLDLDGVRSVLRILRELKAQGKALIVATHELEKVLAMADRVLVLDAGTLAFDGAPGAFLGRDLEGWGLRDPRARSGDIEGLSWLD